MKHIALIAAALALAGCVAGQNIRLHYEPASATGAGAAGGPIAVAVVEQREYVTSGKKQPWYLGHYRAGFGNTWDVVNYGNVPLADQMKTDLRAELASLGFTEGAGGKTLTVAIHDWNFDAWVNGRVWFDVEATVTAADGHTLATTRAKEDRPIQGNFWSGGKGAMEKNVPALYDEIIRKLVRENPEMLAALR